MGRSVQFPGHGKTCHGYLALPETSGPGVIVIQEWWGLVPHISEVAERFASEGFVALAPDLFHGKTTKELDEAGKLMMDLDAERAAGDLTGGISYLKENPAVEPKRVGCVGFCMGGTLSLWLASLGEIDACVDYYGGPYKVFPDYSKISAPVLGHFAETDDWATPEFAEKLFSDLKSAGVDAKYHTYPGTEHAFFNNSRPEVYGKEAAEASWDRTITFFRDHLGQ